MTKYVIFCELWDKMSVPDIKNHLGYTIIRLAACLPYYMYVLISVTSFLQMSNNQALIILGYSQSNQSNNFHDLRSLLLRNNGAGSPVDGTRSTLGLPSVYKIPQWSITELFVGVIHFKGLTSPHFQRVSTAWCRVHRPLCLQCWGEGQCYGWMEQWYMHVITMSINAALWLERGQKGHRTGAE